jgi:hypothetical protein
VDTDEVGRNTRWRGGTVEKQGGEKCPSPDFIHTGATSEKEFDVHQSQYEIWNW